MSSDPHRMDIGKPDARTSSTLHFRDWDQFFAGPSGVAAQSNSFTRVRMSSARVTASIGISAVSSRQRRILSPFAQRANAGQRERFHDRGWLTERRRRRPILDEGAVAQFGHGLLQLGLRVHHDRSIPGDWLLDRLAGHEQEANALFARLYGDFVT